MNVYHAVGLVPGAGLAEASVDHADRPQVCVVVVDLVDGIGPAVTNRYPCESDVHFLFIENFPSERGDVMPSKGFACDVERRAAEGRPSLVKVVQEVHQVVGGFVGIAYLLVACTVSGIRETGVEWRIYE